jgi:hypothetical protein
LICGYWKLRKYRRVYSNAHNVNRAWFRRP